MKTGWPAAIMFLPTLLVVLAPVAENFRANPKDNFPLSYYPMFHGRSPATVVIEHFIGIRKDGSEVNLASKRVTTVHRRHIELCVSAGRSQAMCREAAQAVKGIEQYRDLESVALVRDKYRREDFYSPPYKPIAREVHAMVALSSLNSPGQ